METKKDIVGFEANILDTDVLDTDSLQEEQEPEEAFEQFDPASLNPKIVKAQLRVWTRDEILATSVGQVKTRVVLDDQDSESLDDVPGIFYHEIFGRSKESFSKNSRDSYKSEERKRMTNWGHIELPIPIVQPGLVEKRFLQKIIGAEKADILKSVVTWDAYIARPRTDLCVGTKKTAEGRIISPIERAIDFTDSFLEAYKDDLKEADKRGLIKVVTLTNSHQGVYDEGKRVKCEKIIIINRALFNTESDRSLGSLKYKDMWKKHFTLLPGSYAIMDLLTDINLDTEIKYLEEIIHKAVEHNLNTSANSDEGSVIDSYLEVEKTNETIDRLGSRLKILLGLKKQGISPTEFVTDIIPIQPAHWRDRTKMITAGVTRYTQDGINIMYNNIIGESENIRRNLGDSTIKYTDLRDYKTLYTTDKKNEIAAKLRSLSFDSALEANMRNIQTSLYDYLMSYKEINAGKAGKVRSLLKRTAGKTDNNRGSVLGKRCDYTGRSVITVDQTLALDEIGVPYDILKVHFKEELIRALTADSSTKLVVVQDAIEHLGASYYNPVSYVDTIAGRFSVTYTQNKTSPIESKIYNCLKEILKTKRYLAIRYPSLHKWNELGYKIKIVFDQTIHLNPLVCSGYNADFDGDQMSLFLLTLPESIKEVDELLAPIKNDMDVNGNPMMEPGQDMVMGLYILTLRPDNFDTMPIKKTYANVEDIYKDLESGAIDLHDKVEFMNRHYKNSLFREKFYYDTMDRASYRGDFTIIDGVKEEDLNVVSQGNYMLDFSKQQVPGEELPQLIQDGRRKVTTTVGRIIFNTLIPQNLGFVKREESGDEIKDAYNPANYALEWDFADIPAVTGKDLGKILKKVTITANSDVNAFVRDLFKSEGYRYVSESGISISLSDINTVSGRDEAIARGWKRVEENKLKYVGEELRKANIQVWKDIDEELTTRMMKELPNDNPIKMMAVSGARGKVTQIKQMNTIRGIMMDASNREMDTPILKNFNDGLDPVAFTVSSYGACKGIIDRSNKTAETGDLARHLTYGLSTAIVGDGDCGDREGLLIADYKVPNTKKVIPLKEEIIGKTPIFDILNKEDGSVLFLANRPVFATYYDNFDERLDKLQEQYHEEGVRLRSVRTCKSPTGYCARCAGYFFAAHSHAKLGDAIGQVAAHAVSERATQLTMRTFHTGGVAEGDISAGFAQIKKTIIFGHVTNSEIQGKIIPEISLVTKDDIQEGLAKFYVLRNLLNDPLVRKATLSETINGIIYDGLTMGNFGFIHEDLFHELSDAFLHEVRDAYLLNDISFKPIHFELITKQALSNMRIIYSEDSIYRTGDIIKATALVKENLKLAYEGKEPILAIPTLTGFKKLVVDDNNPITSLFFQNAQEGLIRYSLTGAEDHLTNPIAAMGIGNALPTGKGYAHYKEQIRKDIDTPPVLITDYVQGFSAPTQITVGEALEEYAQPEVNAFDEELPVDMDNVNMNTDENVTEEVEAFPTTTPTEEEPENTSSDIPTGEVKGF